MIEIKMKSGISNQNPKFSVFMYKINEYESVHTRRSEPTHILS